MKNFLHRGLALAALAWLAACVAGAPDGEATTMATANSARLLQFRGEVVHLAMEGGFWGIVAEDGRRYDPGRLPADLQQPGLKVRVTARPVQGRVSFRQWGVPIDVVHIERIER